MPSQKIKRTSGMAASKPSYHGVQAGSKSTSYAGVMHPGRKGKKGKGKMTKGHSY